MYNEKKVAGLWIDHEIAQIITAKDDSNEETFEVVKKIKSNICLLYTSPSPRDRTRSRMPSSA